jgi:hypothetical protein
MTKPLERILVTAVLEQEPARVLLAGTRRGRRMTFHLRRDDHGYVDKLVQELEAGSEVWVDMP